MKWKQPVQRIPDGGPVAGVSAALRQISDGTTLGVYQSDADGFITVQRDGHTEPVYLHLQDAPGGDKLVRSDETHMVGPSCPAEWPAALRALGDGVVRDYLGSNPLAVTVPGGTNAYSVSPGGAVVYGHPVVIYTGRNNVGVARPVSGTFIYRVILRLNPTGSPITPGKADLGLIGPTSDGSTLPALTQTTTTWEMSLARIIVPSSGAVVAVDERVFGGEFTIVTGKVTPPGAATTNTSGVDIPSSAVTLSLPKNTPYVITATLAGEQFGATAVWAQNLVWGSGSNPISIACSANGAWIYVADYASGTILRYDQYGTYYGGVGGYPYVRGICADDNYVYAAYRWAGSTRPRVAKFALDLSGPYQQTLMPHDGYPYAMCCSPTYSTSGEVIYVGSSANLVYRIYPETLNVAGTLSFIDPQGMCWNNPVGALYVVTRSGKTIYRFTYDFTSQGTIPGFTDPIGLEADASGNLVVADYGAGLVRRLTSGGGIIDTFPQSGAIDILNYAGDVIYVLDYTGSAVRRFDQTTPGYGAIALDIDSTVSSYLGLGNRNGSVGNVATLTKQGPATVTIKGKMKATTGTLNLQGLALSAVATPRD